MTHNSEQKPSPLVPFFLGLAPLGFGIHLFTPEASDPPELILSGVLISIGIILLARSVRNFFYTPDEMTLQVAERKAKVPFIERRKSRIDRRASATRRWFSERRHLLDGRRPLERRDETYDRRTVEDRRIHRRKVQKWEDPSVLHPVKREISSSPR
jgi:hypothetical protein